jgi:hypothetical protein
LPAKSAYRTSTSRSLPGRPHRSCWPINTDRHGALAAAPHRLPVVQGREGRVPWLRALSSATLAGRCCRNQPAE